MGDQNTEQSLLVYSDGGSRGNPGPAGIGFVVYAVPVAESTSIQTVEPIHEEGKTIGVSTNNTAEYEALLAGMRWVVEYVSKNTTLHFGVVVFHLDSELVVRQILGVYKAKQPSTQKYLQLVKEQITALGMPVKFVHVPRDQNSVADSLVNQALDSAQM